MQVDYHFAGSTALVTGAAGDIGRAVAVRLAGSGARVALTDLTGASTELEITRDACATLTKPEHIVALPADVTDSRSVGALFAAVTDRLGVPSLLFNNAGYQGAFSSTPDYPSRDFSKVVDVNLAGVFNVLKEGAALMRSAGSPGSVVNSASMAGVDGAPNMVAYSASKSGVIGLTQSAAKDLAPFGIRVNAISPAFIGPGRMWDRQVELQANADSQYFSSDPATVADQMLSQIPMRRHGTVDEVAAAVVWLLSDESSYITGQNIRISGGI